jgi:hypothetical protein
MCNATGKTKSNALTERPNCGAARLFGLGILLFAALPLSAQTPAPVPVPSQFATAQTIFLGTGGAPALGAKAKLTVKIVYESMYRALAAMNKYNLAASPADSDLSMEISILVIPSAVPNMFGTASVRLAVRDTKTQALLWTLDEPLDGAFREATFKKNIDEASSRIAGDLKLLAAGTIPTEPFESNKTRIQQEKK